MANMASSRGTRTVAGHVFWALSALSPAGETEADREDAGMSASVTFIHCLILASSHPSVLLMQMGVCSFKCLCLL